MPSSQRVEVTHNATFVTMVSGMGSNNFTYQWRRNGTFVSEATGDILTITNLLPHDTGVYSCTVMNQYGDSNSSSASLIVTSMHICFGHLKIFKMYF